jgi:D-lactate dehydrogenase (cytochrome)
VTTECIELVNTALICAIVTVGNPSHQYNIADHLFFKLQSPTPGMLSKAVEVIKKIVKKHGGNKLWPAKTQEDAKVVWTDWKNSLYSAMAYAGDGVKTWVMDVW